MVEETIRWAEWREDPAPLYRELRDRHPVFHDAPNRMYLVTRYADVDAVLKDHRRFSSTPAHLMEATRISPLREEDPPRHSFLRRIVMPLFTPREMRRMDAYFAALARELLDQAEQDDIVEVSPATCSASRSMSTRVSCSSPPSAWLCWPSATVDSPTTAPIDRCTRSAPTCGASLDRSSQRAGPSPPTTPSPSSCRPRSARASVR
jgi:hypothetical protein